MHKAMREKRNVVVEHGRLDGEDGAVRRVVHHIDAPDALRGMLVIAFIDLRGTRPPRGDGSRPAAGARGEPEPRTVAAPAGRAQVQQRRAVVHQRGADHLQGRSDIVCELDCPHLHENARQVIDTLPFCERDVDTRDGRRFAGRLMPNRTLGNAIDGVLITFIVQAATEVGRSANKRDK